MVNGYLSAICGQHIQISKDLTKKYFEREKTCFYQEALVGGNLCPICSLTKCCLGERKGKYLEALNMLKTQNKREPYIIKDYFWKKLR